MTPQFAVVGHPNKGKSSIVATLVETSDIAISNRPGTTTRSQTYPMRIQHEVLYELIDTPGFQRPKRALEWLQQHSNSADDRPETVQRFVQAHQNDPLFHDECELLRALLKDTGILYVVDGSKPYGSEYEAEMEILRWTGRPRMALINLISNDNYVEEWRTALDQYFGMVRIFNAVQADASKRIALLQSLAELNESWRPAILHAASVLQTDWQQRSNQSAQIIAKLLTQALTTRVSHRVNEQGVNTEIAQQLENRLREKIRKQEQTARKEIEYLYRYQHIERSEVNMDLLQLDIFSSESIELFGLSRTQLIASGIASGAVSGLGIDVALGGSSLLLGSGIGAAIGGVSTLFGFNRLDKIKKLGIPLVQRKLEIGPIKDPNFPWILLSRAVLHQSLISERNHALREKLVIDINESQRIANSVDDATRRKLNSIFAQIRKNGHSNDRKQFLQAIETILKNSKTHHLASSSD